MLHILNGSNLHLNEHLYTTRKHFTSIQTVQYRLYNLALINYNQLHHQHLNAGICNPNLDFVYKALILINENV